MKEGILSGFQCALGITAAIFIHVIISVLVVYNLLQFNVSPTFFNGIKFTGASVILLLAFIIGINAVSSRRVNPIIPIETTRKYFYQGLIIDLLNPIVSIFYIGMFSQYLTSETPNIKIYTTIFAILCITITWFGFVAIVFSRDTLQKLYVKYKRYFEVISALLLFVFGIKTLLS
jgi:threonine/homoserine/homoserine lactone efflux protein